MRLNKDANELLSEYNRLNTELSRLEYQVSMRLYNLCLEYPTVQIDILNGDGIMAKSLIPMSGKNSVIADLPMSKRIEYIRRIEEYISSQQPKQLVFDYYTNTNT